MIRSKDEFGNDVITCEIGDGFIYDDEAVRVIETDNEIMDVKIKHVKTGKTEWVREWELNDCQVLPKLYK